MNRLVGIIATLLLASSAQAADVDMFYREFMLYETDLTIVSSDTFTYCLSDGRYSGIIGQLCQSEWFSAILVREAFVLTRIVVIVMEPTTEADSECGIRMQDYSHTPYSEMDDMYFPADVAPATYSFQPAAPFLVEDGNFMEFAYGVGATTCNSATSDAYVAVRVYGFPLWSIR